MSGSISDLLSSIGGFFGGGGGTSSGALDSFSGFAPSMSPGQSGVGGFTAPTADDPLTSSSQTGNVGSVGGLFGSGGFLGTGASNADVAKALGALGGGAKGAAAKTPTGAGSQSMNMAQSGASRGGGAAGLDALVRMLNARRDALLPQPVGISASAQARPTQGLLGF